jgi:large subunit ribosomal protein L29
MTRPSALRELNDDELAHHLVEAKEETFHLRFQLALGKQDNSARLGAVRREVARVLTLLGERRADVALPVSPQRGAVQRAKAAAPGAKAGCRNVRPSRPRLSQPRRRARLPRRHARRR